MKTKATVDRGIGEHRDHRKNPRLPPPNPEFARLVVATREKLGLTQTRLAQLADVSPQSASKVEEKGTARADVIIRLAVAMNQDPATWLTMVGHSVVPERILEIRSQIRQRNTTAPFPRLDPEFQFNRMLDRVQKHGGALMCSFVTSHIRLDRDDLLVVFEKMFEAKLHLALVCPFPNSAVKIGIKRPRLNTYYTKAYQWACDLAEKLRTHPLTAKYKSQISVFSPSFEQSAILVSPPTQAAEVRPAFIKYGLDSQFPPPSSEVGAYLRYFDGRPDQWLEIYGGEGQRDDRVEDAWGTWYDYCADIIEAWTPKEAKPFDDEKLTFWKRTESFKG